ncbi:hypothetical protein HYFRA_00011318 [Hymenoscyphus fraxineus]|uniref:Uncharacterized protein n=1 Tax=Hymenoscyphus fraxineus TaxID=746836 RepID=A0A9N9L076_9HELO|nr:hypothetical protein HYFRA_00011318 [Hymenoscyphus fraxineus]
MPEESDTLCNPPTKSPSLQQSFCTCSDIALNGSADEISLPTSSTLAKSPATTSRNDVTAKESTEDA